MKFSTFLEDNPLMWPEYNLSLRWKRWHIIISWSAAWFFWHHHSRMQWYIQIGWLGIMIIKEEQDSAKKSKISYRECV